ncbi:MAG: hypothetical protein V5A52_02020, partial [Halovenus sp.]
IRVNITEWDAVVDELRQFGSSGDVTTDDGWVRLDFGSAYVELSREGWISTGMPLHEFEQDGLTELTVDHGGGSLTVEAADTSYTFRRPGG